MSPASLDSPDAQPASPDSPDAQPALDLHRGPAGFAPSDGAVLTTAWRRVAKRPLLPLLLWGTSLSISLCASLPLLWGLHRMLDLRPAAEWLARGQADILWAELGSDHVAFFRTLLPILLTSATFFWLASIVLSGGFIQALRRPGDPRRVVGEGVLAQAALHARAMLRLSLWGALLRLPWFLIAGGVGFAFSKLAGGKDYVPLTVTALLALLVLLWLWAGLSVVLHYAQIYRIDSPRRRFASLSALRRGLQQARRAPGTTALLALVSVAGLLVLTITGRLICARLDARLLIGLAIGVRQLCALCRAALSVVLLAGAVEAVDRNDAQMSDF